MTVARGILAAIFVVAGVLHFVFTPMYMRIMPAYLPSARLLVELSGVFEVMGGVGLVVPSTRRIAAWGLVALLVAVLPANVQMAMDHQHWRTMPEWALWARVPMQLPMIFWCWVYTRR